MTPQSPLKQAFDRARVEGHIDFTIQKFTIVWSGAALAAWAGAAAAVTPEDTARNCALAAAIFAGLCGLARVSSGAETDRNPAGRAVHIGDQLVACGKEHKKDLSFVMKVAKYIDILTRPYETSGELPEKVQKRIVAALGLAMEPASRLRVYRHKYDLRKTPAENLYEYAENRLSQLTFSRRVIDEEGNWAWLKLISFTADTQTPTPDMPALAPREIPRGDARVRIALDLEKMLDEDTQPAPPPPAQRRMTR